MQTSVSVEEQLILAIYAARLELIVIRVAVVGIEEVAAQILVQAAGVEVINRDSPDAPKLLIDSYRTLKGVRATNAIAQAIDGSTA